MDGIIKVVYSFERNEHRLTSFNQQKIDTFSVHFQLQLKLDLSFLEFNRQVHHTLATISVR